MEFRNITLRRQMRGSVIGSLFLSSIFKTLLMNKTFKCTKKTAESILSLIGDNGDINLEIVVDSKLATIEEIITTNDPKQQDIIIMLILLFNSDEYNDSYWLIPLESSEKIVNSMDIVLALRVAYTLRKTGNLTLADNIVKDCRLTICTVALSDIYAKKLNDKRRQLYDTKYPVFVYILKSYIDLKKGTPIDDLSYHMIIASKFGSKSTQRNSKIKGIVVNYCNSILSHKDTNFDVLVKLTLYLSNMFHLPCNKSFIKSRLLAEGLDTLYPYKAEVSENHPYYDIKDAKTIDLALLSSNPILTFDFILRTWDISWRYICIANNNNVKLNDILDNKHLFIHHSIPYKYGLTFDIYMKHKDLHWNSNSLIANLKWNEASVLFSSAWPILRYTNKTLPLTELEKMIKKDDGDLSSCPSLTIQFLLKYIEKKCWNWESLSANYGISILDILDNPQLPWKWNIISSRKDLTLYIIKQYNLESKIDYSKYISNPNNNDIIGTIFSHLENPHLILNSLFNPAITYDEYKTIIESQPKHQKSINCIFNSNKLEYDDDYIYVKLVRQLNELTKQYIMESLNVIFYHEIQIISEYSYVI